MKPRATGGLRRAGGYTLTEVMVAAGLSAFILVGVLSAFLVVGRTGFVVSNYSVLEAETRRALDTFGQDVRKATGIQWNSHQSVTLFIAAAHGSTTATYAYDTEAGSPTRGCFYRVAGDASSVLPRRVLVRNVATDFTFRRFKLEQPGVADNTAANDLETKQIEVTLRATRTGITAVSATQSALSARYILRNKRVSN